MSSGPTSAVIVPRLAANPLPKRRAASVFSKEASSSSSRTCRSMVPETSLEAPEPVRDRRPGAPLTPCRARRRPPRRSASHHGCPEKGSRGGPRAVGIREDLFGEDGDLLGRLPEGLGQDIEHLGELFEGAA